MAARNEPAIPQGSIGCRHYEMQSSARDADGGLAVRRAPRIPSGASLTRFERCFADYRAARLRGRVPRARPRRSRRGGSTADVRPNVAGRRPSRRHRDPGPWLATIAKHAAIDVYRREASRPTIALTEVAPNNPAVVTLPPELDTLDAVWQVRRRDRRPSGRRSLHRPSAASQRHDAHRDRREARHPDRNGEVAITPRPPTPRRTPAPPQPGRSSPVERGAPTTVARYCLRVTSRFIARNKRREEVYENSGRCALRVT